MMAYLRIFEGNHPQMALIQVSELLQFTQIDIPSGKLTELLNIAMEIV